MKRKARFERKIELQALDEHEILRDTLDLMQKEKLRDQMRSKSRERDVLYKNIKMTQN